MQKVLIIDNYDSFTYNLLQLAEVITEKEVIVKKNDEVTLDEIKNYTHLILSPGPGLPDEAGLLKPIINRYKHSKKIFGVCLGLQAIAEVYGCHLIQLNTVYHGIETEIEISQPNSKLYKDLPSRLSVGRYHSWVIDKDSLPSELMITASESEGNIMSIEHTIDKVYAVQYHPESIMTPLGKHILSNFLDIN